MKDDETTASIAVAQGAADFVDSQQIKMDVEFVILGAFGLGRADSWGKGADPYVVVVAVPPKGAEVIVGKTAVSRNTLDPRWENQTFTVVVPYDDANEAFTVRLDVFDSDRVGAHACLGQLVLDRDYMLEAPRLEAQIRELEAPGRQRSKVAPPTDGYYGALEFRTHISARVVVYAQGARNLCRAGGAGKADPYAAARWLGHKARKVGRTVAVKGSLSPTWDHAFVLAIPVLRQDRGGRLQIDVWGNDYLGADDFLGRANLEADFILRQRTTETFSLPLQKRKPHDKVQGHLECRVYVPKQIYDLVTRLTVASACLTNNTIPRCHVRVKVLFATNIRNADCCGYRGGDPYAVVYRDGKKVGRTPARSKTRNPVWETSNLFVLENVPTKIVEPERWDTTLHDLRAPPQKGWFGAKKKRGSTSPVKAGAPSKPDDSSDDDGADSDEEEGASDVAAGGVKARPPLGPTQTSRRKSLMDPRLHEEMATDMPGENDDVDGGALREHALASRGEARRRGEPHVDVRIDLFDDDLVSRDFLGTAAVPWATLMRPGEHSISVTERPGTLIRPVAARFRITGTVTISVSHVSIIEACVTEGVDLAMLDSWDVSDPYAIVKWNSKKLAKTKVRDNDLDPKWYGGRFTVDVPLEPEPDEDSPLELCVEVWEKDALSGDDFMGLATIPTEALLWPSPGLPRLLSRRPGKPEDPNPQGYIELEIRSSFVPGVLEPRRAEGLRFRPVQGPAPDAPAAEITMKVLRAGGLLVMDLFGGADPFVIVRKDGRVVGRTATRNDTLRPVWKDAAFNFSYALSDDGTVVDSNSEIRVEVWDADFAGKSLMGLARLGVPQLMACGVVRYALQPERPSKAFYDRPEANDPGLGWIEVDCALYASLTLEVDRADGLRAADASGTSDAYVKARWAGAQARDLGRSDVEKRTLDPRWAFRVSLSVPLTTPTNQFAALVLEVWDHDASGGDEFLGLCAIDPHELVTGADDGASKTTRLLDKSASGHVKKEALGTLTWRVHRHKPVRALRRLLAQALKDELTRNTLDGATVKFEVLRCGELPSVGGGLADSYVKVFCHGLKVGQTTVVEHSRNPHWPGDGSQVFTLRDVATKHGAQARDHFLLRLTVFHSNAVGADDTLGEAAMGWDHLMQEGEHTLTLRERVFDTKRASAQATALKKQMASYAQRRNKGPQNAQRGSRDETPEERGAGPGLGAAGAAGPALGDARRASAALRRLGPNVVVRVWHISRVRLHLVGGLGLRAADVSLLGGLAASDPYAVVRFLGKKVSKTRICRATLDPVWNHVVDLDLPTFQPGGVGARTELLIEVWDSDALGTDDLLGVVAVSHDELVRPHRGDVFELGPRPNAPPGAPRPTGCLHIAIEASFIPLSHEPVRWPRHPDVGEALASYYRRGDDGQNVGDLELRQLAQRLQASAEDLAKEAASRAWEHRDISSAVDAKSGRRFWYERLAGAARARAAETGNFAECRRWWYDPRPAPVPPSRTFDLPPLPPRPSPTKRAYLRLNEPLPGDDHYAFKACVVVEVVVLRARGLRNADSALLGGKSDPYAVVRHGPPAQRETVGRTRVVRDSLDPVWGDEPMRFACGLDAECAAQELLVEVWDSDGAAAKLLGGRDDALGQCTILPSEYLNATGPIRKALRPQPGEPAVTGWIELKINLLGRVRLLYDDVRPALDPIAQLEMSLKSLDAPRGGEPAPPALAPQWSASMYDGAAASLFDGAAASVPQLQLAAGDGADGGALAGALAASKSRASLARRASSRGPRYECAATWIGWHERLLSTVRAARGSATALQAVVVDVPLQREGGFVDVDVWRLGGGATKAAAAKSKSRVGNAAVSTADLLQEGLPTLHLALDGRPKSVRRTAKRHDAMVLLARVDCPAPLARLARAARASRELQETANTVPALDGLEIDVLRAFNLQVADSQLSDPFVVAWHRGVKVGQTRVKKNTLNPVWEHDGPSATFPLRHFRTADDAWGTDVGGAPAFDRDERCVLLEVWDSDGVGRRPDFLGHCVLRHADLLRGGDHELLLHELEFQDLEKDVQWARKRPARQRRRAWCCARAAYQCLRCLTCPARAFGKCAAAALCLCCACAVGISRRCCRSLCPCLGCCARKAPVRGRLFVRVRHRATVHLRICEAFGLMAADKGILGGGSSDPYCVVEYKGEKLAQTRVRSGTRDALYYEALQLTIDVPLSPFGWDADDGAPDGALRWDHPGRAFQRANGYALTITVWDRDTFSKDDFLGQVVLRPEALLRPQNGTAWPLKPRNAADIADLDGEASGGLGFLQLEVCASHVPGSLAPELRRQHGALGRYDEAMNAAGRAYYYDAWTRETFWNSPEAVALAEKVRRLDARPQRQASVRGWLGRKRANPYDVVSQSRLTMQGAAPLVESGTVGGAVVDLELDAAGAAPQCVFKLTVVRAMGLDRADTFGKSDPYVVVRCAGHKVGRTKTIKQNLDPEWLEDVVFAAPLPTLSPAEVQLEVWDWDAVGLHDLLGTAYVKTTDLLKRTGRLITLPLSGRPGGKNAGGTLLLRPEVYLRCALEICSASRVRGAAQAEQYVSVSWSGLERGKSSYTATCFDGLGPVWDERRTLLLPLRFPTQCLTVELREHRRQSEDAFVGRVNVDAAMLAGDAGRGEDPPPRRFALVGEDDEQISRPLPNQRRGSHIPDPAKMRRIIEAQWDAVAADEMASGEADSKTDEAAQKNPLLRLGNGLTDVDGTAKDGSAKDVPAKDAAAGKKVIRRAQKGPAPVPQPAGKKAPARGKGCLANCFAPRRADGDAAQPAEAPPAAAANARQVEADSDAALDARSENGDEVGDVLTLRFSAQRDVSQLFSEARAAWRQRPSANEIGTLHAEVEILRCDGLRPADFFSGKSDPFVVLTAGGDAVGKTRIVFKSLNPKWAEERFLLPFFAAEPKNALEASACRVEFRVMDHDALGADDFLGYQALDHAALLESLGTWRTIDLKADPDAKDEPEDEPAFGSSPTKSKKKKAVAGWGKLTFRVQLVARVGITLVGAHGLGAGGRAPDTYARVLYLGERWGADTKVCADTTRPVWFYAASETSPVDRRLAKCRLNRRRIGSTASSSRCPCPPTAITESPRAWRFTTRSARACSSAWRRSRTRSSATRTTARACGPSFRATAA
ncbi:C2 domain-containing protein [Pelagophyceae sp. CCMP2097]|nr:C2 domain-containing protein [Pelagophyceae sp. CCMP2097]